MKINNLLFPTTLTLLKLKAICGFQSISFPFIINHHHHHHHHQYHQHHENNIRSSSLPSFSTTHYHHHHVYSKLKLEAKNNFLANNFLSKNQAIVLNRKKAIQTIQSILLSILFSKTVNAIEYPNDYKKTIIITGSNSGIGYDAALRMAERGHTIILACRTLEKAQDAAAKMQQETTSTQKLDLIAEECNLANLESIFRFADRIVKKKDLVIDVLCLNAGIARNVDAKDVLRTDVGFELTVGTNHFGHFYLTNMLINKIQNNNGRIVVTASAVHDPDSPGGAQGSLATLGNLNGLKNNGRNFDMVDGGAFDADKAYKDSKLCNVLFTRELQKRCNASVLHRGILVNCFSPGLIVGTGLFRDQNPFFTKLFDIAATNVLKVGESVSWGGGALEYMALSPDITGVAGTEHGGLYYNSKPGSSKYGDAAYGKQFTVSNVSVEARDDAKAKELWILSEELLGLKTFT